MAPDDDDDTYSIKIHNSGKRPLPVTNKLLAQDKMSVGNTAGRNQFLRFNKNCCKNLLFPTNISFQVDRMESHFTVKFSVEEAH